MTDTVAYLRVSTEEQARPGKSSLSQQREACELMASRLNRTVGQWFEDAGASGGSANRPAFQALASFCRGNPRRPMAPGLILCLNHSRWGRFPDPNDATWWMQEMKHVGWLIRFAEGGGLEGTPVAPILDAVQNTQATAYREALRANCRRAWQGTARQGYWQNEAPFGYRREAFGFQGSRRILEIGQRKSEDEKVRLTPGPDEEVRLVRWLFEQYASGGIGTELLAARAFERFPGRKWNKQWMRLLLQNPAYVGDVVWGRRENGPDGTQSRKADPSNWVIYRDAHPALVSRSLFEAVQVRLAANRTRTRLSAGGYPLSGILSCAHCGDPLAGGGGPIGPPGDLNRYRAYRHAALNNPRPYLKVPAQDCPARMTTVPKRIVEPAVVAAVAQVLAGARFRQLLERGCDRLLERFRTPDSEVRDLSRRKARLVAERDRVVKLASRGTLTEEEAAGRLPALRSELAEVDAELQRAQFADRRADAAQDFKAELVERALNFAAAASSATGAHLRDLLRPWVHSAVVDRNENVIRLAISPLPIESGFLVSTSRPGPGGRVEKEVLPLIRRSIPIPPARSMQGKRLA